MENLYFELKYNQQTYDIIHNTLSNRAIETNMLEPDKTFFHEINNKVTSYLFHRVRPEIIIGIISALIIAFLFKDLVDQTQLLYWTVSIIVVYLLRLVTIRTGESGEVRSTRSFLFFLLIILCGALWGAAGYSAMSVNSDLHKIGLLIWLVCLSVFFAVIYLGKISYFLGFILPALGLSIWALYGQSYPWNPLAVYTLIAIGAFLVFISFLYHNRFLEEIRTLIVHQDLVAEHNALIEKTKKLQMSLKSTNSDYDETLANLDKTSKDLNAWQGRSKVLIEKLRSNIRIDPVTNLSNQRTFTETVDQEWQRSIRSKEPVTVAYITVDKFDDLQKEEDKNLILTILKKVGASIKSHGRRAGDLPAHLKGANFGLLLLGANAKDASRIVDDIRTAISNLNLVTSSNEHITVHAGVATQVPDRQSDLDALYEHAESSSYEAEFQGGDRVVSYRGFSDIEIISWEEETDGELNETNFEINLFSKGFNTKREEIPVNTVFKDQSFSKPTMFAVYSGSFVLEIEGQAYTLNAGEHLILPDGMTFGAEVAGDEPVVLYLQKR